MTENETLEIRTEGVHGWAYGSRYRNEQRLGAMVLVSRARTFGAAFTRSFRLRGCCMAFAP